MRTRGWLVAAAATMLMGIQVTTAQTVSAPEVELRDGKGRRVSLSDFRGKIVIVDFWASWCAPCQLSFPALDALHREYRARGVEVIGINVDARRANADRFLATRPHEMLVAFDPRARALEAFGAPGVPSSFVIDRTGRIRYAHEGYDQDTLAAYRSEIDALLAESGW